MKKNQYLLILGAIALSAISFFAGTRYQLSKSTASQTAGRNGYGESQQFATGSQSGKQTTNGQNGAVPSGSAPGGMGQGGMLNGEITAKDDKSITIKTMDGSTKIIILADSTNYKKSTDASLSDLKVGETVNVIGTSNSDGSVTAKNVTVGANPEPIGQGQPNN